VALLEYPTAVFLSTGALAAAHFSGTLRKMRPAAVALAVFHGFIFSGMVTMTSVAPPKAGNFPAPDSRNEEMSDAVDKAERHHALATLIDDRMAREQQWYKTGRDIEIHIDENRGEIFALIEGMERIIVFDTEKVSLEKQSFRLIVKGQNTEFDLDPASRLIAGLHGPEAVTIDADMLEWVDTLDLGLSGPADICFGATGTIYVSNAGTGVVHELRHGPYGHGLEVARTLELQPGALTVAYLPDRGVLLIGNYFMGGIYVVDTADFKLRGMSQRAPYRGLDEIYAGKEYLLLEFGSRGSGFEMPVSIEKIIENAGAPGKSYGLRSLIFLPVNFAASIR